MDKEENIVKRTCKELGLTYRELAEEIGYKSDTVNKSASTGKVSEPLEKAINMFIEIRKLQLDLEEYENLKTLLKKATS